MTTRKKYTKEFKLDAVSLPAKYGRKGSTVSLLRAQEVGATAGTQPLV